MSILTLPTDFEIKPKLLQDKVILVTGAGDGIGRTAAKTFGQLGATVLLLGRTVERLERTYDEMLALNTPTPTIIPLDLEGASEEDYTTIADAIATQYGRLDGLLHNASVLGRRSPISDYPAAAWEKVMQINVNGAFLLTKQVLPLLDQSPNGSVVFTSSSVGRKARAYWGAYAVSKFATEGMSMMLADELEGISNTRVNCINPGATRTHMRATAFPAEDPNTVTTPEDIMPLYTYLLSDESIGISGESFDAQPK